jgi:hypothetical protein
MISTTMFLMSMLCMRRVLNGRIIGMMISPVTLALTSMMRSLTMKIHVVFEYPDVKDIESDRATFEIAVLTDVLNKIFKSEGLEGYIDEVTE